MNSKSQSCVVILGSGRSGTSLAMQILVRLGYRTSNNDLPSKDFNPRGFFEDTKIIDFHRRLNAALGINEFLPLPDSWQENPDVAVIKTEMVSYVREQRDLYGNRWVFKDPRANTYLPLWRKIFNAANITPFYLLCVRSPGAVVKSMVDGSGTPSALVELMWLKRNLDALENTQGNFYLIHYEELLDNAVVVIKEIANYLHLGDLNEELISELSLKVIDKNLNRSSLTATQLMNPVVNRFYSILRGISGNEFDRQDLFREFESIKLTATLFEEWSHEAIRNIQNVIRSGKHNEFQGNKLKLKATKLEEENKGLKNSNNLKARELEKLNSQLDEVNKSIKDSNNVKAKELEELKSQLKALDEKLRIVSSDLSHSLGVSKERAATARDLVDKLEKERSRFHQFRQEHLLEKKNNVSLSSKKTNKNKQHLAPKKPVVPKKPRFLKSAKRLIEVAIKERPGVNTFLLPFRLFKLAIKRIIS